MSKLSRILIPVVTGLIGFGFGATTVYKTCPRLPSQIFHSVYGSGEEYLVLGKDANVSDKERIYTRKQGTFGPYLSLDQVRKDGIYHLNTHRQEHIQKLDDDILEMQKKTLGWVDKEQWR